MSPISASSVALTLLMPVTVDNCANWLVTCPLSIGLSGSWFLICVTSRVMKRFWASSTLVLDVLLAGLTAASRSGETLAFCTVVMV